tara:strand:+ start:50 stop:574 length:525 start_codon:yes stop_codon:yes gene_type:complete
MLGRVGQTRTPTRTLLNVTDSTIILAGLSAAAWALDDKELMNYVYDGMGTYMMMVGLALPQPFKPETIYVRTHPSLRKYMTSKRELPYGNFSPWATVMATHYAEKIGFPGLWSYRSTQSDSILAALNHYAPYIAGTRNIPAVQEKTDPGFFAVVYQMALHYTSRTKPGAYVPLC